MKQFFTPMVVGLLLINAVIFLFQYVLRLTPFLDENRLIVSLAMYGQGVWHGQYWRLLTSLFLHGGWEHLLFNMLALFSFGYTVEKTYGPVRFLLIYLVGGMLANVLFGITSPNGLCIGASGAVATVLMLSAMKYPGQIIIVGIIPMPIRFFVVAYVGIEAFFAFSQLSVNVGSNIAHFAHLGGLMVGYLYFVAFDNKPRKALPA